MNTNTYKFNKGFAIAIFALVIMVGFSPLFSVGVANASFTECSDGYDNNFNGLVDQADPACHTDWNASNPSSYDPTINAEHGSAPVGGGGSGTWGDGCNVGCGHPDPEPEPQCSDGIDNDHDGVTDWAGGDKSCTSANDDSENTYDEPYNPPSYNDLRVSCYVSDTRIEEDDRVTYEARVSGGRAPYTYRWDGDDNDVDGENDDEFSVRYDREGRYEAEVTVWDRDGNRDSDQCRDVIVENDDDNYNPGSGNRAPIITSAASASANTGATYIYDVNAYDPDGDNVFYSLVSGPAGLTINPNTGLIQWVPSTAQGNQSHFVSLRASDGRTSATQSFSVYVQRPVVITQPPVVYQPPVVPVADLEIISLRVDNDAQGNAIVSFETNIPANGSVAYSLTSHADDRNANNYENRVNGFSQTTFHQVNLGQLEINRTYYLRALASTSNDSDITAELAFVQLPTGITLGTNTEIIVDDRVATMTLGSAFAVLFGWLFSPWLLLLIIIILLILILLRGRDKTVISHGSGPTRIQS